MKWRKLGQVFVADHHFPWMATHAAAPFAERLGGPLIRIYFSPRDAENRSCVASLVFDLEKREVVEIDREPVLLPGELGLFDDSGCVMGFILPFRQKRYLYYIGWNLKVTVPWLNTIGLAIYNPETSRFEKVSRAPVMDRSEEDPFTISYPSILEAGGLLKMWYGSNLSWGASQESMRHVIKTAVSEDGVHWQRTNKIAVDLVHSGEFALSKPFVMHGTNGYEMWYSYRGRGDIKTYRIGYATSDDGNNWTRRDDDTGIDVSSDGWDSEMICYPNVFDNLGARYMLYTGNGYGKAGFGLAIAE